MDVFVFLAIYFFSKKWYLLFYKKPFFITRVSEGKMDTREKVKNTVVGIILYIGFFWEFFYIFYKGTFRIDIIAIITLVLLIFFRIYQTRAYEKHDFRIKASKLAFWSFGLFSLLPLLIRDFEKTFGIPLDHSMIPSRIFDFIMVFAKMGQYYFLPSAMLAVLIIVPGLYFSLKEKENEGSLQEKKLTAFVLSFAKFSSYAYLALLVYWGKYQTGSLLRPPHSFDCWYDPNTSNHHILFIFIPCKL